METTQPIHAYVTVTGTNLPEWIKAEKWLRSMPSAVSESRVNLDNLYDHCAGLIDTILTEAIPALSDPDSDQVYDSITIVDENTIVVECCSCTDSTIAPTVTQVKCVN